MIKRITRVSLSNTQIASCEHIERVEANGQIISVDEVIKNSDQYYTEGAFGNKVPIEVVQNQNYNRFLRLSEQIICGRREYIRSKANSAKTDNLLLLPRFK